MRGEAYRDESRRLLSHVGNFPADSQIRLEILIEALTYAVLALSTEDEMRPPPKERL